MSLNQVDQIIEKVEKSLQRDFIISSTFADIDRGVLNKRRRSMAIILNIITCIDTIRALIATVASNDSVLHVYSLNTLFGYGFMGRFMAGCYSIALPGTVATFVVFFINEGRGALSPVTKIKQNIRKVQNPSNQEIQEMIFHLRVMLHVRNCVRIAHTTPMAVFVMVGAVITSIKFDSLTFGFCYIPVWIVWLVNEQYICNLYAYVNLIIAQSTLLFKLRLRRVDYSLRDFISLARSTDGSNNFQAIQNLHYILRDLDEVLKDITEDNLVIKHWLRDVEMYAGGVFALSLVFIFADTQWYFRLLILAAITFLMCVTSVSFLSASHLNVKLRKTAKMLYTIQTVLNIRLRHFTSIRNSFELLEQKRILKSKFSVMRMIHRLSSRIPKVGFSVGDMESFTPMTTASFISSTVVNSLMLMTMQTGLSSMFN